MRKCNTGLLLFVATIASASPDAVFFVDTARVRALAEKAAYAEFPDIPPGGLVEDRSNRSFTINCRSALDMGIVSEEAKDFEICSASFRYHVKESLIENRYRSPEGLCMLEMESERISVSVYEDGSTKVGGIGRGRSSHSEECSEEFEGWKE